MRTRAIVFLAVGLTTGTAVLAGLGELDTLFGTNGIVQIDVGLDSDVAGAVFAQEDGRLLVGRNNNSRLDDFSVLRLNANGSPDLSFGNSGRTALDVPGVHSTTHALVQQADGKIVAGGVLTLDRGPANTSEDLAVARFLADGWVDTTFGSSGVVRIDFSGDLSTSAQANAIVQQSDGKLVAAGSVAYMGWWDYGDYAGHDMVLVRLDAAGGIDPGFGKNGRVLLDPTGTSSSEIRGIAQQADGRLVAVGRIGADMAVVRLTRDGVLDPSLGGKGFVVVSPKGPPRAFSYAKAVALQADGKILVGGMFQSVCDRDDPVCDDFVEAIVARLNPDGSPDPGFGVDGIVTIDVPGTLADITDGGLVMEPAGTILIAGGAESAEGARYGFVMRLATNGATERSFGSQGVTLIDLGRDAHRSNGAISGFARHMNGNVSASLTAVDQDGRDPTIVVARLTASGNNPGRIGLANTLFEVDERGNANFVVRRTGGTTGEVRVDYATHLQAGQNPPASAVDFAMSSGTLTWLDGDASDRAVTILIATDAQVEAREHFTLDLSNPTGGAVLAARQADVAISDINDNAGLLQFELATRSVYEGDISTQLLVTRTGGSRGAVSVSFSSYGLSAVENEDFSAISGPLNWADGETGAKGIRISTIVDGPKEADESFRVRLKEPTGGATLGTASTMDVTIIDGAAPSSSPPPGSTSGIVTSVSDSNPASSSEGGGGAGGVLEALLLSLLFAAQCFSRRRQTAGRR